MMNSKFKCESCGKDIDNETGVRFTDDNHEMHWFHVMCFEKYRKANLKNKTLSARVINERSF